MSTGGSGDLNVGVNLDSVEYQRELQSIRQQTERMIRQIEQIFASVEGERDPLGRFARTGVNVPFSEYGVNIPREQRFSREAFETERMLDSIEMRQERNARAEGQRALRRQRFEVNEFNARMRREASWEGQRQRMHVAEMNRIQREGRARGAGGGRGTGIIGSGMHIGQSGAFQRGLFGASSAAIGLFGQAGFPALNIAFAAQAGMAPIAIFATALGESARALQRWEDGLIKAAEAADLLPARFQELQKSIERETGLRGAVVAAFAEERLERRLGTMSGQRQQDRDMAFAALQGFFTEAIDSFAEGFAGFGELFIAALPDDFVEQQRALYEETKNRVLADEAAAKAAKEKEEADKAAAAEVERLAKQAKAAADALVGQAQSAMERRFQEGLSPMERQDLRIAEAMRLEQEGLITVYQRTLLIQEAVQTRLEEEEKAREEATQAIWDEMEARSKASEAMRRFTLTFEDLAKSIESETRAGIDRRLDLLSEIDPRIRRFGEIRDIAEADIRGDIDRREAIEILGRRRRPEARVGQSTLLDLSRAIQSRTGLSRRDEPLTTEEYLKAQRELISAVRELERINKEIADRARETAEAVRDITIPPLAFGLP